jgi:hypothetical protein
MSAVLSMFDRANAISKDMIVMAQDLFARGTTITDGAITLYKSFGPAIDDLAVTLTAVWGGNSLQIGTNAPNSGKLSIALYNGSGTNWPREMCNAAATRAVSSWHGELVRKSTSDIGAIPYPSNNVYCSPDIICSGGSPATAAQIAQWISEPGMNQTPWTPATNADNYFYIRARNLYPGESGGNASLYTYRSSIGPQPPSKWRSVPTMSEGRVSVMTTAAAQGVIITADDPFVFNPGSSGEHLCMIAMISTEYLRNTRPSDSNFDIVTWQKWNGASAWRNIDIPKSRAVSLGLANHNASAEAFRVEAVCRNVPAGTEIRLSSNDSGASFDTGSMRVPGPNGTVSAVVDLPPSHDGTVTVEVAIPGGGLLPKGSSIDLRSVWLVDQAHNEFDRAAVHLALARSALDDDGIAELYMGNFVLVGDA